MLDWDIVLKDKVLIQCKSFNRDNVLRLIFSIQRDKIPSESFKNNKDNVLIQNYPKYQDKVISVLSLSQISAHWDLILIQNYTMHQDKIISTLSLSQIYAYWDLVLIQMFLTNFFFLKVTGTNLSLPKQASRRHNFKTVFNGSDTIRVLVTYRRPKGKLMDTDTM